MSLQAKPPEKKENSSPPPSSSPSFSLLPDEITVNYLARISRSYYPKLSVVSKSFRSLLSSTDLYKARSQLGSTEQCLYVCQWDCNHQISQWFALWVNPNRTLPNSSMIKKKTTGQVLVPITSSNFPLESKPTVAVGSEIYVIGGRANGAPSSAVRILDCRSHTWRDAPRMNVARKKASSCVYDGKIYVLGGCKRLEEDEPWAEVFDTKTQTWEFLPNPGFEVRMRDICRMEEIQGKIYFGSADNMYAYDPKQGKWECCENGSAMCRRLECVMENVSYSCVSNSFDGPFRCWWYDIKVRIWKKIKGLDSLRERNGDVIDTSKLVSCGGKLLRIWEVYMTHSKKIWCAEIKLEKRDGGEVWGEIEWVDVVHTISTSRILLHCLAVSI